MPLEGNQGSGAVTPAAIDMDALAKLIQTNTQAAVAEAVKPLNERLAKFETAQSAPAKDAAAKEAAAVKPITEADIDARVEAKFKAAQEASTAKATRDAYLGEKLKDLPEAYRSQLGSDPAKFAEQEQKIRDTFKADFKAAGGTVKDVAGVTAAAAGGVAPAAGLNLDQNSPQANIAAGLRAAEAK